VITLVMLQAGTIVWLSTQRLAPPEVTPRAIPRSETTRIRVVFDPRATEQDIRSALQALGGRIVDGPTTTGTYVIELPPEEPATLGRKIRELRERPGLVQHIELVPQTPNALR
jgi:hypothetical protein